MLFMIKRFAIGATSNFFGEYIALLLYNHLEQEEQPRFTISVFISTIIAGGFLGTITYKIDSLLAKTALAVGLTHSLIDVIDRMMGGTGLNHETFIEDFIFDTIIVFYIVLIITKIYEMLYKKTKNEDFSVKVLGILPLSIAINTYYNYRYASEENQPR